MCLHITGYKISDLPTLAIEMDRNFYPSGDYEWLKPIGILAYSHNGNRKRIYDAFGYPLFVEKRLSSLAENDYDYEKCKKAYLDGCDKLLFGSNWQGYEKELKEAEKFQNEMIEPSIFKISSERMLKAFAFIGKKYNKAKKTELIFFTNCCEQSINDGYVLISITN